MFYTFLNLIKKFKVVILKKTNFFPVFFFCTNYKLSLENKVRDFFSFIFIN